MPATPSTSRGVFVALIGVACCILVGLFCLSAELRQSLAAAASLVVAQVLPRSQPESVTPAPASTSTASKAVVLPTVISAPAIIPRKQQPAANPQVIVTVTDSKNRSLQIVDEPIPPDCHPELHADYEGYAVLWGLGNKARSAAECCRMCKEFKPRADVPHGCNIWVWCGDPSGKCWTMDIHDHKTGDCWLKYQAAWDGEVDRSKTNLVVNHRGKFTDAFRSEHKTAPEMVPWVAGLVKNKAAAPAGTAVN